MDEMVHSGGREQAFAAEDGRRHGHSHDGDHSHDHIHAHSHSHSHAPDPARRVVSLLLVSAALVFVVWHFAAPAKWQDSLAAYFLAFTLEATPFILLGTLVAALLEQLLPPSLLPRLAARLGSCGIAGMALVAPLFPTCECGVVSVGRSLLKKGLPLPHTLAYLLAAPIVNPMVLLATYLAFGDWRYPALRAIGGLVIPVLVALLLRRFPVHSAFRPQFVQELGQARITGTHAHGSASLPSRMAHMLAHLRTDFLEMTTYFLAGVAIASVLKTFFSAGLLSTLGSGPVSGTFSMMLLAFVLSLCSEADAFLAAGFTEFSMPAKLAFLLLGPMLDIKLLLMYRSMLRGRFLALFSALIVICVAAYALLLEALL